MDVLKVKVETINALEKTFCVNGMYYDYKDRELYLFGTADELIDILRDFLEGGMLKKVELVGSGYTREHFENFKKNSTEVKR